MKFGSSVRGYLKLGVIFGLFMLVISLLFALVIIPVLLIPLGIGLLTGSGSLVLGFSVVIALLVFVMSFMVVGWAVMYFYRKNVFVHKRG